MTSEPLGIATELSRLRKLYCDYAYQAPVAALASVHHITVNAKTGERTVRSLGVVKQPAKAKPIVAPERVQVPAVLRERDYGDWRRLTDDGVTERVEVILRVVAEAFNVTVADMLTPGRAQRLARPRFAAMVLLRKLVRLSLPSVGKVFRRDHTTVMSGIDKARALRRTYPDFRDRSIAIVKALRAQAKARK